LRKLLEKLDRDELLDFLEEYTKNDTKLANALNVRFVEPEFEYELIKIKNLIDNALDGVSDYSVRDSWGNVSFYTGDIIEEIHQRTDQGHIRIAFAEVELLYRKLLSLFEYQGECEISDEAGYCLSMMSDIADKAISTDDKKYIFKQCIKMSELKDGKDYGADYEDELLKIAAKFATTENRMELERALARFDSSWREEEIKLIHLGLIQKFDGEKSAECFIYENLRCPKIREIAFVKSINNKNYAEAERLCIEALSIDNRHFGISPWIYKLYSVYEETGNIADMEKTAKKILFCGDLTYYEKLKTQLIRQKTWDNQYTALLSECAATLSYTMYMEILEKEHEHKLLLKELEKHTSQVYNYGKILVEKYPSDVSRIFNSQINTEADAANKRERYRDVCLHIVQFSNSGCKTDAARLVMELKDRYKHRPAFVDELTKIL